MSRAELPTHQLVAISPAARLDEIARLAAVLGFELNARLYPTGSPVRDAGQLRLNAGLD